MDAVVLRLRAAGCVFAEDEAKLLMEAASTAAELNAMLEQRVAGLPLEHILGWAEFCGLRIHVEPGVFVPRQRTRLLVRQAALLIRAIRRIEQFDGAGPRQAQPPAPARPSAVVVDLCCGSGAVAAALATTTSGIDLHAADLDPAAVRCARQNITLPGQVYEGDLFQPLPTRLRGHVDVLTVNAPYVPSEAIALMPPEARDHEPRLALDGGPDGMDIQRQVAAQAPSWLTLDGHLLIETSEQQAPELAEIFTRNGLVSQIITDEHLDAVVVVGARAGSSTTERSKS